MRKTFLFPALLALLVLLSGCRSQSQPAQIAATTLPVYEFTSGSARVRPSPSPDW